MSLVCASNNGLAEILNRLGTIFKKPVRSGVVVIAESGGTFAVRRIFISEDPERPRPDDNPIDGVSIEGLHQAVHRVSRLTHRLDRPFVFISEPTDRRPGYSHRWVLVDEYLTDGLTLPEKLIDGNVVEAFYNPT